MISIIIPVFNAEDTLLETLNSVANSGIKDQEIIIIDDFSTDRSLEIINVFKSKNDNVKISRNPRNLGGGATRNVGVDIASNDLIFILDSDDILVPGSLAKGMEKIKSINVDAIANGFSSCFVDDIKNPVLTYNFDKGFVSFENLISRKPNSAIGNMLIKKESILKVGGYPEHHGFDTQAFGFRLLANSIKIYVSDIQFYYQRLPTKPSYYIREMKAGNVNKNWFFIFIECLYKFNYKNRKLIIEYPYSDPFLLAKGNNIYDKLVSLQAEESIFDSAYMSLSDSQAYEALKDSSDITLQAWCFVYEIKMKMYDQAFSRIHLFKNDRFYNKLLYFFIQKICGVFLNDFQTNDMHYFLSGKKNLLWKLGFYAQKVLNRLNRFKK